MLPVVTSQVGPEGLPLVVRRNRVEVHPSAAARSHKAEPIKPLPPVTKSFIQLKGGGALTNAGFPAVAELAFHR